MREDVFARIDGGAEEIRTNTSYYWDNSKRLESNRINLQRTLSGEGFFEESNGRRYAVPQGTMMAFTQRENSRYGYPATGSQPYHLQYLSIDSSASANPLFNRIRQDFGPVLSIPDQSESGILFQEAYERFNQGNFRDRYHESELIIRLFTAIYRQQVAETQGSNPIEYCYHLLHNRYADAITLKGIAKTCGVTREHLIRAFTKRYHTSPGAMLRELRLSHAKGMLESTSLPIEQIAAASGFSSSNVFCRAFRNTYHTSPARHRSLLR
ncbi:helix-turn-helix transcriptional regulator [Pelagicoccus albus]|uniref:Helix-turn-helix transcriptional regulator n=2 Tax=Pelagicoccus albus TaxID=415222 RepID=A0A7X1B8J8_9BACT|nr:helix-turn-helix transcriptional regulator [Pelagicoccus albus]